jgi:hypothetical protein
MLRRYNLSRLNAIDLQLYFSNPKGNYREVINQDIAVPERIIWKMQKINRKHHKKMYLVTILFKNRD